MDEAQINDIVDRVVTAIESLQPVSEQDPGFLDRLLESITFAPLVTLIVGILAAGVAWRALWQRSRADDRAEWWRRTQWALDNIPVDPGTDTDAETDRAPLAYAVLNVQVNSELAKKIDLDVIEAILPFVPAGEDDEVEHLVGAVEDLPGLPGDVRQQLVGYRSRARDAPSPEGTVDGTDDSEDTGRSEEETHERPH